MTVTAMVTLLKQSAVCFSLLIAVSVAIGASFYFHQTQITSASGPKPWPRGSNRSPLTSTEPSKKKTDPSESPTHSLTSSISPPSFLSVSDSPLPLRPGGSEKNSSHTGYVLTMHYVDQITASTANFLSLQCFVGHYLPGVKVVEPFLLSQGTILGASLSKTFHIRNDNFPEKANQVMFSDLVDNNRWKSKSESQHYAPFVSWDKFLNDHPKALILVHHTWTTDDCDPQEMRKATREFVADNNFEIVKQVCLNFKKLSVLSPQKLIDMIYGDQYKQNNVAVVFYYWGGIVASVQNYRFSIDGTSCDRGHVIRLTHPSKRISDDVKEYTSKYMSSDKYIAVMIRFEHYGINRRLNKMSPDAQRQTLTKCFRKISSKVKSLKRQKHIKDALLTMDFSRHGSCALWGDNPYLNVHVLNETVPMLFDGLFGESLKQDRWEESFSDVADFSTTPGYVGILQKTLAASARCLIVVGGGSFQGSAVTLHNELHPGSKCVLRLC